jgi:hypothetical protein
MLNIVFISIHTTHVFDIHVSTKRVSHANGIHHRQEMGKQSFYVNAESFRTIKDCIKRIHCDSYTFATKLFSFDTRLIDTSHKDYLGATGSFLNPIDLLAEWLLTIGDEDIIFEPEITVNQQSGELYT